MAAVARLFGVDAPALETASILEIGCSTGANLFPMALQYPGATFLGIDLSENQIATANASKSLLGISNISFTQCDLRSFSFEPDSFDYIICHGVFSWAPEEVQEAIFSTIQKGLTSCGVALVSYNCHPGWATRSVLRDTLLLFDDNQLSPEERVAQARAVLTSSQDALVDAFRSYGLHLREEIERTLERSDSFFIHELLDEHTGAFTVHELSKRALGHHLNYLGDAHPSRMRSDELSQPRVPLAFNLQQLSPIEREQLFDYLFPVSLRASLFTRATPQSIHIESLQHFWMTSPLVPLSDTPDIFSESRETFCGPTELTIDITEPVLKSALIYLRRMWPETVTFQELYEGACALCGRKKKGDEKSMLQAELLKLFFENLVEFYVSPLPCIALDTHALSVSPFAQLQAQSSDWVTSQRHEAVPLDTLSQYIVGELSSHQDFDSLLMRLLSAFEEGKFVAQEEGNRITEEEHLKKVVSEQLLEYLEQFAEAGLLCCSPKDRTYVI